MVRSKKQTLRDRYDAWLAAHPALARAIIGASAACAIIGIYAFVTFSGFGASAEFIYNQF